MAFNFPSNPTAGQVYGNYTYNATTNAWDIISFSDGIPAGVIMVWGASTAPTNWLICDGSAVSRSTYASLFNAIGTTYGSGNGSTTFNLPDLRGRVAVGKNIEGALSTLGATGGSETHTLTTNEMPSHTHTQNSHNHTQDAHSHGGVIITGGLSVPNGSYYGVWGNYGLKNTDATTATNQATTATNQNTGGGQAHNNLQPYVVTNYIIKYSAANTPGDSELATRVGALETADASTNKAGLVPIIPSSISVSGGSASVGVDGTISFTSCTGLNINGIFDGSFRNYLMICEAETTGSAADIYGQLFNSGSTLSSGYVGGRIAVGNNGAAGANWQANSGVIILSRTNGSNGFAFEANIINPFQAKIKKVTTNFAEISTIGMQAYINPSTSSYTGMLFYANGTTMNSGTVKVYGYR